MELSEGALFANRYRLLKEQGRGSFGEVWLAQDEQLDNMQVAIKVYIALDDRGIEEFKKEYKTAYGLNHPNLLHAHHFDVCDKRPYLVMPYCPDSALSLIGNCDVETLWKLIGDVSSGLAYLHSLDIVHHDIKPDNILRTASGDFVITDFGISTKMRSTLRRNSTRAMDKNSPGGSLPYMGPEMFSDSPQSIKATDIWAFGVTLYEIITGNLPFLGQGGVMQMNGAKIPKIDCEDSRIANIVTSCMAQEPWDRPTAEDIFRLVTSCMANDPCDRATAEDITVLAQKQVMPSNAKKIANKTKKRHTIIWPLLFVGIILGINLITTQNPQKSAAKKAFPEYSALVSKTRAAIVQVIINGRCIVSGNIDIEDLNIDSIKNNIKLLKSLEDIHAQYDKRYNESTSLEKTFEHEIQKAFDAIVSEAEKSTDIVIKADLYYKALRFKENSTVREKYNALVDKMNGIKRVDFVMIYSEDKNEIYADRIDYRLKDGKLVKDVASKPLVASEVTYMYIYFEFQDFDGVAMKYNNQTFYVKILRPDGTLMTNSASPEGYTFKETVNLKYEGYAEWKGHSVDFDKVWCSGYGNDRKTAYQAGTYKVQVYNYKGRQLFSVPVTFK